MPGPSARPPSHPRIAGDIVETPQSTLLDVFDELLNRGVMANGEVMLGVAGIDLIYLRLSALLCAADRVLPKRSARLRPGGRSSPKRSRSARRRKS
jgi:hypothetical protein